MAAVGALVGLSALAMPTSKPHTLESTHRPLSHATHVLLSTGEPINLLSQGLGVHEMAASTRITNDCVRAR